MRAVRVLPLLALALPAASHSQSRALPNQLSVQVEPVAVVARYGRALGSRWRIGPSLGIGPFHGVTLRRAESGSLREWATLYAAVSAELAPGFDLVMSPVGAVLLLGDDFSSLYPTAQVGLELSGGRWVGGSDIRVIRIAGSGGSGRYWVQWIPARVGLEWTW